MKFLFTFSLLLSGFFSYAQNQAEIIKKGDFYGLFRNEEVIIPPVYNSISPAYALINNDAAGGFYLVRKRGKYGFYNSMGAKILDAIYDTILPINNCLAAVKSNRKFLFSLSGTCLPACDYELLYYDNGFIFLKDKKYHLYDDSMRFFVTLDSVTKYLPIQILEDSIAMRNNPLIRKYPAMLYNRVPRFVIYDGNLYGVSDNFNREVYAPQFHNVEVIEPGEKTSNMYILAHSDSLHYVIDTTGKTIFISYYSPLDYYEQQKIIVAYLGSDEYRDDRCIVLKTDGSRVMKDTFESVSPGIGSQFIGTYHYGWKNLPEQRFTVFDTSGKTIIPPIYVNISAEDYSQYYKARKFDGENDEFYNNPMGIIDTNGKVRIPCYYREIEIVNDGYAKVVMDINYYYLYINKKKQFKSDYVSGLVTLKGKVLFLTDKYESFNDFNDGLAVAKLNSAYDFYEEVAVKTNDRDADRGRQRDFFYINMKGKLHGRVAFDVAKDFENGFAIIMNFNDQLDYDTGEETLTIDIIDKKSIWFRNPKKAAITRKTTFSLALYDALIRAKSKDFILFETGDSCVLVKRNKKGVFEQSNYQKYRVLPYDPMGYIVYFTLPGVPQLPDGFALQKNGKYALFDAEANLCSDFVIDSFDLSQGMKIFIGEESGYINEYFEVLSWDGKNKPVFRRNNTKKNTMIIVPKPIFQLPEYYYHYNYNY